MSIVAMIVAGIVGLLTIAGVLWGIGYSLFIAVAFVKAVFDRANDKESAYYSKNVER